MTREPSLVRLRAHLDATGWSTAEFEGDLFVSRGGHVALVAHKESRGELWVSITAPLIEGLDENDDAIYRYIATNPPSWYSFCVTTGDDGLAVSLSHTWRTDRLVPEGFVWWLDQFFRVVERSLLLMEGSFRPKAQALSPADGNPGVALGGWGSEEGLRQLRGYADANRWRYTVDGAFITSQFGTVLVSIVPVVLDEVPMVMLKSILVYSVPESDGLYRLVASQPQRLFQLTAVPGEGGLDIWLSHSWPTPRLTREGLTVSVEAFVAAADAMAGAVARTFGGDMQGR